MVHFLSSPHTSLLRSFLPFNTLLLIKLQTAVLLPFTASRDPREKKGQDEDVTTNQCILISAELPTAATSAVLSFISQGISSKPLILSNKLYSFCIHHEEVSIRQEASLNSALSLLLSPAAITEITGPFFHGIFSALSTTHTLDHSSQTWKHSRITRRLPCYGLNCVPQRSIHWSPKPYHLKICLYLDIGSLKR